MWVHNGEKQYWLHSVFMGAAWVSARLNEGATDVKGEWREGVRHHFNPLGLGGIRLESTGRSVRLAEINRGFQSVGAARRNSTGTARRQQRVPRSRRAPDAATRRPDSRRPRLRVRAARSHGCGGGQHRGRRVQGAMGGKPNALMHPQPGNVEAGAGAQGVVRAAVGITGQAIYLVEFPEDGADRGCAEGETSWGTESTRRLRSVTTTVSEEKEADRMALLCHY